MGLIIFGNQLINWFRQELVDYQTYKYNNFLLLLATAENCHNIDIATAMSEAVACGNWQLRNNVDDNNNQVSEANDWQSQWLFWRQKLLQYK